MKKLFAIFAMTLSFLLFFGVTDTIAQEKISDDVKSQFQLQEDTVKPLSPDAADNKRTLSPERFNRMTPDEQEAYKSKTNLRSDSDLSPDVIKNDDEKIIIYKEEYYNLQPEKRKEIDANPELYMIK